MKILKVMTIGAAGLLFSVGASAVLISDVGGYDTLLTSASLPNSGNEESWIEGYLKFDIDYTQLSEASSQGSKWEAVTNDDGTDGKAGDYAFSFGSYTPDYFLVKIGGGNGTNTIDTHFLYENKGSDIWAFLNLVDFGPNVTLTNIGVISHVGRAVTVPEPGTIALLGLGLAGLGLSRRRKSKALEA